MIGKRGDLYGLEENPNIVSEKFGDFSLSYTCCRVLFTQAVIDKGCMMKKMVYSNEFQDKFVFNEK